MNISYPVPIFPHKTAKAFASVRPQPARLLSRLIQRLCHEESSVSRELEVLPSWQLSGFWRFRGLQPLWGLGINPGSVDHDQLQGAFTVGARLRPHALEFKTMS